MASFDTNHWYQIVLSSGTSQSLDGTVLYDAGKGATFFKETNTSAPEQQWQLFPVGSTYYVLRTKASGARGYLNTAISVNETTPGQTVPDMRNGAQSDDSMFWQISPWNDGTVTYYLTNKANGTNWHLDVKSNSLMAMSSDISAPQPGQQFLFKELDTIDNTAYSSALTPTATSVATQTGSTTTEGIGPKKTAAPPSDSGGLSTGAKAAIGASIGFVALIALFALGFFIIKRRKRNSLSKQEFLPEQDIKPPETQFYTQETYKRPYEMSGQPAAAELAGHRDTDLEGPVELPASNR